jgi:hypothetical protein
MVIDYRLLNKKVVFDAFPMPSVEHAFAIFQGAIGSEFGILSVLCRNWVSNLGTQLALASRPSSSRSAILALAIKGWGRKTRVVLLPPPTLVGIRQG